MRSYFVYIATNKYNTILYTGVTCDIYRRMLEHKEKTHPDSFTARYNVCKLVYVECTEYVNDAIAREKQIKGWTRKKKIEIINSVNPDWNDLLAQS